MANQATAKKGEEFRFGDGNVGTTKDKVLFERIVKQRKIATGEQHRNDLTGKTQKDILTGKSGNVVDFLEYKAKKQQRESSGEVDSAIRQISQEKANALGGDEVFENKLEKKLVQSVINEDLKTKEDQIIEVKNIISENTETNGLSAEVEAKEVILGVKKVEEEHPDEVREIKGKDLIERIEDEAVGEVAAEVLYGNPGFKNEDLVLENDQNVSDGKRKNSQWELQVGVGLLSKTPDEVKRLKDKYKKAKSNLKNDLPFGQVPQLAALDRVLNSLEDEKIGQAFDLIHRGGWINKIKNFDGKQRNNSIVETTGGFISKVGNQAAKDFVRNSVGILATSNFYSGFRNVLSGILNGGVKMISGTVFETSAVFRQSGNGSGFSDLIVSGGGALLGKISGGLKDLGVDLAKKAKNAIGLGGKKALGWLMGGAEAAAGSASVATAAAASQTVWIFLVVILVISLLTMIFAMEQSSTVAPVGDTETTSTTTNSDTSSGTAGSDKTSTPEGATYSVADKVVLTGQCRSPNRSVPMRADGKYSGRTICTSGCGPTATSEILQGQNAKYTPKYLMSNSSLEALDGNKVHNLYYNTYSGNGTTITQAQTTLILVMGKDKVTSVRACNVTTMRELIKQGMAVLVHMRYGNGGGHYAVAVAANNSGTIWIKDNGNSSVNEYPNGAYYKRSGGKTIDRCFGVKVKDSGIL